MKKIKIFWLFLGLWINQLLLPMAALAQVATATPTVEPTPTDTPVPTPTDSVIPTDTPTLIPTPTDTPTVTPTDTPTLTPTPTTEITPTTTPTATPSASPTPTGTVSIQPVAQNAPATVVVVVSNSAEVNNQSQSNSNTGDNTIETATPTPSPAVTPTPGISAINTGDAVALGNIVNVVNTTGVGSSVKVYLMNNITGQMDQIDLNSAWNLLNNNPNVGMVTVDTTSGTGQVNVINYASIVNSLNVLANSGNNLISGGNNNLIATGNAYALANILNLVNTNLFNSKLFLGVINIDGSTFGDLVLPNPSNFISNGNDSSFNGSINNVAVIGSNSSASANSGGNQIDSTANSNNLIQTGNSVAVATNLTITNVNMVGGNIFMLALNNLGNWTGQIYNWQTPGSVISGFGNETFVINSMGQAGIQNTLLQGNINNAAYIDNLVTTIATTGGNSINSSGGDSLISTGNAWAQSNITTMANLNLWNSSWFYGLVNVIGNWKGNVIFAYPDLTLALAPSNSKLSRGDNLDIFVNLANVGYDGTGDAAVTVNLPDGLGYLGDDSGIKPSINGQNLRWVIGQLNAKEGKSFTIHTKVGLNNQTAFNLVKDALAAEINKEMIINGQANTSRAEVSVSNNSASTEVWEVTNDPNATTTASDSNLWPKLTLSVKNNVNNWVYPKDVVTFEINGKNEGEATAYNTYFVHQIVNSQGQIISENKINAGSVGVSRSGKITFGIPINYGGKTDEVLTSKTIWIGYRENGDEVKSDVAETQFLVKGQNQVINSVQAAEPTGVLGTISAVNQQALDLLPYLLLFLLSSFWILKQTKIWLQKK